MFKFIDNKLESFNNLMMNVCTYRLLMKLRNHNLQPLQGKAELREV